MSIKKFLAFSIALLGFSNLKMEAMESTNYSWGDNDKTQFIGGIKCGIDNDTCINYVTVGSQTYYFVLINHTENGKSSQPYSSGWYVIAKNDKKELIRLMYSLGCKTNLVTNYNDYYPRQTLAQNLSSIIIDKLPSYGGLSKDDLSDAGITVDWLKEQLNKNLTNASFEYKYSDESCWNKNQRTFENFFVYKIPDKKNDIKNFNPLSFSYKKIDDNFNNINNNDSDEEDDKIEDISANKNEGNEVSFKGHVPNTDRSIGVLTVGETIYRFSFVFQPIRDKCAVFLVISKNPKSIKQFFDSNFKVVGNFKKDQVYKRAKEQCIAVLAKLLGNEVSENFKQDVINQVKNLSNNYCFCLNFIQYPNKEESLIDNLKLKKAENNVLVCNVMDVNNGMMHACGKRLKDQKFVKPEPGWLDEDYRVEE